MLLLIWPCPHSTPADPTCILRSSRVTCSHWTLHNKEDKGLLIHKNDMGTVSPATRQKHCGSADVKKTTAGRDVVKWPFYPGTALEVLQVCTSRGTVQEILVVTVCTVTTHKVQWALFVFILVEQVCSGGSTNQLSDGVVDCPPWEW